MKDDQINNNADMITAMRESLNALNITKKSLEMEGKAIVDELTSGPNPMGIDTPLVDVEGFPRGDIDLFRTRSLRSRLAIIRTDHASVIDRIETSLRQLAMLVDTKKAEKEQQEIQARLQPKPKPKYDPVTKKWVVKNWDGTITGSSSGTSKDIDRALEQRSFDKLESSELILPIPTSMNNNSSNDTTSNSNTSSVSIAPVIHHPAPSSLRNMSTRTPNDEQQQQQQHVRIPQQKAFARVNSVADNSPASQAGLQPNDTIIAFGSISYASTSDSFQLISDLVMRSAASNETIEVLVERHDNNESNVVLRSILLQPRPWDGRGVLGCHIVPI
jgi:Nas2 N_terminal domain/PDZ domain